MKNTWMNEICLKIFHICCLPVTGAFLEKEHIFKNILFVLFREVAAGAFFSRKCCFLKKRSFVGREVAAGVFFVAQTIILKKRRKHVPFFYIGIAYVS